MIRTAERTEFLSDVLVGAVENYGYGWFKVIEYDTDAWTAKIQDNETEIEYDVDLDTIARGIGVVNSAVNRNFNGGQALANGITGARLFMPFRQRREIIQASRDNDAGELDVIDCLAILECAIFGAVTYA